MAYAQCASASLLNKLPCCHPLKLTAPWVANFPGCQNHLRGNFRRRLDYQSQPAYATRLGASAPVATGVGQPPRPGSALWDVGASHLAPALVSLHICQDNLTAPWSEAASAAPGCEPTLVNDCLGDPPPLGSCLSWAPASFGPPPLLESRHCWAPACAGGIAWGVPFPCFGVSLFEVFDVPKNTFWKCS